MKHLLLVVSCLFCLPALATGVITGNLQVNSGDVETYQVAWSQWDTHQELVANVGWVVQHGTLLWSDKHSATVQWDEDAGYQDLHGSLEVYEDVLGQGAGAGVMVFNTRTSASEFCPGAQGPAVISMDFGSGVNPGGPLPAGTTSYAYSASCSIIPNRYARVTNSVGCNNLWHDIPQDHTPGDVNGYFLMVDAAEAAGEFYRGKVNGLTPAFRYEFSAWVGNLDKFDNYEEPRLRFELHGEDGFFASSGDIVIPATAPFQWQKVGFMFDLPEGIGEVDVVMVNRNRNGMGNDLVLDDVTFAPCYPPVVASFESGVVVNKKYTCNSGSVNLRGWWPAAAPFTTPAYQWQRSTDGTNWMDIPGATSLSSSHSQSTPGIHQYRLKSYEALTPTQQLTSNPLTFYVQRLVVEPKVHHLYSCSGGTASGHLPVTYRLEYSDPAVPKNFSGLWSPSTYLSNPAVMTPNITLPSMGASPPINGPAVPAANYVYTVTVTDSVYGCMGSAQQTVSQHNPRKVAVANAFTPNGDGVNDLFRPVNLEDYPGSWFHIFNRWGQKVFTSQGPTLADYSWNGTFNGSPQEVGSYTWQVQLSACPGNIINASGTNTPSGSVTLIR